MKETSSSNIASLGFRDQGVGLGVRIEGLGGMREYLLTI